MAETTVARDAKRDAEDCREAMLKGAIQYTAVADTEGIEFGDDSGLWAFDAECDDPRFRNVPDSGGAMSLDGEGDRDSRGKDATDCYRAFRDGLIQLRAE